MELVVLSRPTTLWTRFKTGVAREYVTCLLGNAFEYVERGFDMDWPQTQLIHAQKAADKQPGYVRPGLYDRPEQPESRATAFAIEAAGDQGRRGRNAA